MKFCALLLCMPSLLLCFGTNAGAKRDGLARLPAAALLTGSAPQFLAVTTPNETWEIQPEAHQPKTADYTPIYPSISLDGRMVACARVKSGSPLRVAVAIYSILDKKWTEYAEAEHVEAISISPDKSKLAFISNDEGAGPVRLHVLDIQSRINRVITSDDVSIYSALSWSPDGERIVYQIDLRSGASAGSKYEGAINVIEVKTGRISRVANNGQSPAWSPLGEWIAYLDSSGTRPQSTKCMAVHPDGTQTKILFELPHRSSLSQQRYFVLAPVWSPDSTKLLLNELQNLETWSMNLNLLDVATHKLSLQSRKTPAVLGWAKAK